MQELEHWPLSRLIEYARNPRKNDHAVDKVAAAIREFGFRVPIVAKSDGTIIDGHLRFKAARRLALDTVPVLLADDMTPEQIKAFRISVNKVAELAEWDDELLALELSELREADFDLNLIGFDEDELDNLLKSMGEESGELLGDEDEVPEAPTQPVTVLGDTWLLGRHRVKCGDSTSITDADALMNGAKASMVFTDPPYGVEYQSNMRTKSQKFDVLANDDKFLDITPIIEIYSSGWVFIWTSWKVQTKWIDMFKSFDYPTNIVVWHKPGGGIGDLKRTFSSDYEIALVWHRGAELCGKRIGSVWTINKDGATKYLHPTQKPVALAEEAIDKTTRNGALVLDLFLGSGSTLIAAEKTGRVCYGMELSPAYCDVIVKRWQTLTGKQATLESTGQTFAEVEGQRK
jgi:DNA modification methylase